MRRPESDKVMPAARFRASIAAVALGVIVSPHLRAEDAKESQGRAAASRNLRKIALAMHNYHSRNGHLPPEFIQSPDGKPLLSWRVAILPFLGHQKLYDAFRLDQPWDSPHNKALLAEMPEVFAPGVPTKSANLTNYLVFAGEHTVFPPTGRALTFDEITDGTPLTILAVQGGEPVPWTKPEDIAFTPDGPLPRVTGPLKGGFLAVMANGAVHFVSGNAKGETIRAAVMRDDGRELKTEDLAPKSE